MWKNISGALGALALTLTVTACDVDVKDEGEMPEVEMKGGRMPDVDVRGPEVDVTTEPRTVQVPTDVDVRWPQDRQPAEQPAGQVQPANPAR